MSRDKGEARVGHLTLLSLNDLSTRSPQFRRDIMRYNCALCLASLPAFPAVMGDASGRRTAACRRTADVFVDAAMQADVDSNPRRRRRPHEGAAAHAAMLEMNNTLQQTPTSGR